MYIMLISADEVNKKYFNNMYSKKAILSLAGRGKFPSMKMGRRVWFDTDELEKHFNSLKKPITEPITESLLSNQNEENAKSTVADSSSETLIAFDKKKNIDIKKIKGAKNVGLVIKRID